MFGTNYKNAVASSNIFRVLNSFYHHKTTQDIKNRNFYLE